MTAFLQFWDRVELWLATLPFPLQVMILLVMGLPLFFLVAVAVEKVADVLVHRFRALVAPRTVETRKEVR
ncbi:MULTISPECIES: hypothetical protein [Dietzia]|uniref:Uncharacterized protein n=1 Tax=Dietzia maris TaxID=37915 RepID=A0ABT8GZ11_9ACTN|nr:MULTISPECIES: hypothetical protein [Dietzia]MBB1019020.1 hypothetical protein [Dietzia sp. DQ11-71]MDN4505452.1 hypothetical protein [Dietzia maris]